MAADGIFSRLFRGFGIYVAPTYPSPDVSFEEDPAEVDDISVEEVQPEPPSPTNQSDAKNEEVTYFKYSSSGEYLGSKRIEYITKKNHLKHLADSVMMFQYHEEGQTEERIFIPMKEAGTTARPGAKTDLAWGGQRRSLSTSTIAAVASSHSKTSDIMWDFPEASVTNLLSAKCRPPQTHCSHYEMDRVGSALDQIIQRYGTRQRVGLSPTDKKFDRTPSLTKYVPVEEKESGIVPLTCFDTRDKRGWCELQVLLTKQRSTPVTKDARPASQPVSSHGRETSDPETSSLRRKLSDLLNCSLRPSQSSTHVRDHSVRVGAKKRDNTRRTPALTSRRFQLCPNRLYCRLATKGNPVFRISLHIELQSVPRFHLCHLKTELLITAMKHFFHPWSDVQALWVANLDGHLQELLDSAICAKAMFGMPKSSLGCYSAAMLVSRDAGRLLRHRDVGLIATLAKILEIHPSKLLVLLDRT